eukprot:TRINITY_DN8735_c0_g1_i4.p1 TRINITY_DN8735_c0_g1~~TRINITY_DN8735_c0_g1_i4.p1  ORF type:complete len:115 (+),score=8.04 TRINITY_DN8735_c0_g1_i4:152-496(+)
MMLPQSSIHSPPCRYRLPGKHHLTAPKAGEEEDYGKDDEHTHSDHHWDFVLHIKQILGNSDAPHGHKRLVSHSDAKRLAWLMKSRPMHPRQLTTAKKFCNLLRLAFLTFVQALK